MRLVTDELPRAMRLSNTLSIILLLFTLFNLITFILTLFNSSTASISPLFTVLLLGIQYWLVKNYSKACKLALESQSSQDIEQACRKQATMIKFYGLLCLLMLIIFSIVFFIALSGASKFSQF